MQNETWFKFLVWSMASFFFFVAACVLIATFGPVPSQEQSQLWMEAMMATMEKSLMGYSMQLEEGSLLAYLMYESSVLIPLFALGGLFGGLLIRFQRTHGNKIK
ncbi:MAG: hypothetical protein M0Z31_04755 [Clostridia bacterium]|nr:hypothetical protein [Clostridia bacterium]